MADVIDRWEPAFAVRKQAIAHLESDGYRYGRESRATRYRMRGIPGIGSGGGGGPTGGT